MHPLFGSGKVTTSSCLFTEVEYTAILQIKVIKVMNINFIDFNGNVVATFIHNMYYS